MSAPVLPPPPPPGPPDPLMVGFTFVQTCPACGHPAIARSELRAHEALLEHWSLKHS